VSQIIVILALLFAVVIAIFAVQNTTSVPVRFLTYETDGLAVSVLVLISAAFGALVMLLLGTSREISLRWHHRAVSHQLKTAQARVAELESAQSQSLPSGDSSAVTGTPPATATPSD
jgi:uncharacterized integral membrane protein